MKKIYVLFLFCCLTMFLATSSNAELIGYVNYTVTASWTHSDTAGTFYYENNPTTTYDWSSISDGTGDWGTSGITYSHWEITGTPLKGTINKLTIDLNDSTYVLDLSAFDDNGLFVQDVIQSGTFVPVPYPDLVYCTGRLDDYGIYNEAVETLSPEIDMQMDVLDTINQDQSESYSMEVLAETAKLEIVANWGGSEMLLQVFDPLGNLYASKQATDPPIKIEVLNPTAGQWRYDITAIEVPYENYPVAVMAGTSAVPIPSAIWLLFSGLISIAGFRRFKK